MFKEITLPKKEVILSKEDVRKELEQMELNKAKTRAKIMASACVGMGAIKVTQIVAPKVIATYATGKAFLTGSTYFIGLALPNTAFLLGGLLVFSAGYSKYKIEHKKIKDEQAKNPDISNLYKLGECQTEKQKENKVNDNIKDNKDTFKL